MPVVQESIFAGAITDALEESAVRLRAIRGDIEQALTAVETALTIARRMPVADQELEQLLEAQHDRIARTIAETVSGAGGGPSRFLFRLDPADRAAKIGRRRVPLTESEYKVLEALWEAMPAPVSRDALLEKLYGSRGETTEAVIDMFIFKIRSKLRAAGCADASIRAIRGLGWVLDLDADADAEAANIAPTATDEA